MGDKWDLFRDPETANAARLTGCKNLAAASWAEGRVTVPEWGLTLAAPDPGRPVSCAGIRAHFFKGVEQPGKNVFHYEVLSAIEDTFSVILMIRPDGAAENAALRWELSKDDYAALPAGNLACIAPENVLLLNG